MSYSVGADEIPADPAGPVTRTREGGYEPEPGDVSVAVVTSAVNGDVTVTTIDMVPVVSLAKLVRAATVGTRYTAGVKAVQSALARLRFLGEGGYTSGMFDSATLLGYRNLQLHLGFSPGTADGVPDKHSFTWLALRTSIYRPETGS